MLNHQYLKSQIREEIHVEDTKSFVLSRSILLKREQTKFIVAPSLCRLKQNVLCRYWSINSNCDNIPWSVNLIQSNIMQENDLSGDISHSKFICSSQPWKHKNNKWNLCSKLTITPRQRRQWHVLVSLLLTLNRSHTLLLNSHCWLWVGKFRLG